MRLSEHALIVAGGKGTRMNSDVPKQFLELQGLPVLMRTLQAFYQYNDKLNVVLVLPEEDWPMWTMLCEKFSFRHVPTLQKGGKTRFQSVKNGLDRIEGDGWVAIHDGVRPLVSVETIATSFRLAAVHQSAVATVPLKDSLRTMVDGHTKAVDRNQYRIVQTPQTFHLPLVRAAYLLPENPALTDDASVVEQLGHSIHLFEGSYDNLKITTPEDMVVATALWSAKSR